MRQWLSADLLTGNITGDLTSFEPQYPIRHTLSNYDTATGKLSIDGAPPDWRNVVRAGATILAAYDDADPTQAIQWGAYVSRVQPDNAAGDLKLSLSTVEGYLLRRYVGDVTYTAGTKRSAIVADLVAKWAATTNPPGVPIQVVQVGTDDPALLDDLVLQNTDNASVFQRISDLVSQLGGEWTINLEWQNSDPASRVLVPVLYIGGQIGRVSTTGVPTVTFESPGQVVSVDQPDDYGDGMGANIVTAYSSGQGSVTPYAPPVQAADFRGRPAFEYRYQPVANETRPDVLAQHAQQALTVLQNGAQPLALVLATDGDDMLSVGRRLGADWGLGDSVGYNIEPDSTFPDGLAGTARVIAYDLDVATITPIFAQPEIYTH